MSDYERVHARVTGSVQGVGYRFFAVRLARRLELGGWVRNCPDGSVEVVAEGEKGMLRELVGELKRGPSYAHVTGVSVTVEPYTGQFRTFDVTG